MRVAVLDVERVFFINVKSVRPKIAVGLFVPRCSPCRARSCGRQRNTRNGLKLDDKRHAQKILFEGDEEKRSVASNRTADRTAELILLIVQFLPESVGRSQCFVAVEIKYFAAKIVRSRFCHDVDKTGVRSADFGVRARTDDLKFSDGGLRKKENRFVAAALIALKCVVKIRAVNRHIGIYRTLSGNDQAVSVRFLHDRRSQLNKLGKIAPAHRQIFNQSLRNNRTCALCFRINRFRVGRYSDSIFAPFGRQKNFNRRRLTNPQNGINRFLAKPLAFTLIV